MNKLIFIFVAGTSLALLGPHAVSGRGMGGSHPNESREGESRQGESRQGESRQGEPRPSEPQADSRHPSESQPGQPHGNQPQMTSHGANVPLPTDAGFGQSSSGKAAMGYGASEHKQPNESATGGAAAGHAAAEQKQPQVSGATGAAAGYAATQNKQPNVSGVGGAAAGHAAAEQTQPQVSGAAGAAAGYAATQNKQPNVSGVGGAAAGYAATERNQPQVSGATGAAAGYAAAAHHTTAIPDSVAAARGASVRTAYSTPDLYGKGWYAANPGAWSPAGWSAGQAWGAATWPTVGTSLGWGAGMQPMVYNYGTNITYQGDQVYSGGQPVATADQYYQQASTLAQSAPPPDPTATDWTALGVFALVQNDQAEPHYIVQLAVNKAGALGGNYSDLISGTTHPIHGAVDKTTQRVAWTVGDNKNTVGETGLYNLTQNEAQVLLHIGKDKTQQWMLVRLKQPEQASSEK